MKNIKKHILFLVFALSSIFAFSQVKFYAKGANVAYTGKAYVITFVLENGNGKNFRVPQAYPGFQIIGGPNQSSSTQWINGVVTSSKSYSYYLQPIKEGTFTIPKASVQVGDESLTTEEIKVTIKKGTQPKQNTQTATQNSGTTADDEDWKEQVKKDLFVRIYTDKTSPYVGEQVNVYLKLYQNINTAQMGVSEMPDFGGFWKHDYELKNQEYKKEQLDGKWYNTLLINKYALFPLREGDFDITPMKMEAILRLRTKGNPRDIFSQIFGSYEQKRYAFQSNTLKVKVKPLPLKGQPENFYGAVGSFKYSAVLDSVKALTGNSFQLKTSINGTGNIMMIDAPEISFDETFEVYDPSEKEYISKKSANINGTKKYNYNIIANEPGDYKLDPISFSFFDLNSKSYKTVYSDTLAIKINPSAEYIEAEKQKARQEIKEDKSFRTIALENDLKENDSNYFVKTGKFMTLFASPSVLFFLLLFIKKRKDNYNPDLIALNRKKANKLALKKLKQASVYLKANDPTAFYNEVIRSLWDYVSLKLDIDPENLSKDNIKEELLKSNATEETANEYVHLIENCEMAIYTPNKDGKMQEDFDQAKEIIIKLEGVL